MSGLSCNHATSNTAGGCEYAAQKATQEAGTPGSCYSVLYALQAGPQVLDQLGCGLVRLLYCLCHSIAVFPNVFAETIREILASLGKANKCVGVFLDLF
jgi:hypothetical protein